MGRPCPIPSVTGGILRTESHSINYVYECFEKQEQDLLVLEEGKQAGVSQHVDLSV